MSDELNEIRMKKARELMQLLDKKEGSQEDEEKYEELKAMMPWSFRVNIENGSLKFYITITMMMMNQMWFALPLTSIC